jgi:hypothetical protein
MHRLSAAGGTLRIAPGQSHQLRKIFGEDHTALLAVARAFALNITALGPLHHTPYTGYRLSVIGLQFGVVM